MEQNNKINDQEVTVRVNLTVDVLSSFTKRRGRTFCHGIINDSKTDREGARSRGDLRSE